MDNNLRIAIQASIEAGKRIMKVYNTGFDIEYKDDDSPLTEADKQANDIINTFLKPTNIPIISEENRQTDYEIRQAWSQCWIVDPVDGTKEFIKRNGEFTVNIALALEGLPILGVIYVPALKTLYYADVREGIAFKANLNEHQFELNEIIKESNRIAPKKPNNIVQVVGSRSHMNKETLDFVESIKQNNSEVEIVSKGSSLKFCLVAEGQADVYPRFAPTMEWDTAAGQAICNAVGVDVISKTTNNTLKYNKENLLNPWFMVSLKD